MDLVQVQDFKVQMVLANRVYFRIRLEIGSPADNRPHRPVNGYNNSIV